MIEINFKYKGKKNIIKCQKSDLFKTVYENFAKKLSLDIDDIFFIYQEEEINTELDLYVEQQFEKEVKKKKRVEIMVCNRKSFIVRFSYNGKDKDLKFKETDKLKDVLKRFEEEIKLDLSKLFILYASRPLEQEDYEKTLIEIANPFDKKDKVMTLCAYREDNSLDLPPEEKTSDEVLEINNS